MRRYEFALDLSYFRVEYTRREAMDMIRHRYGPIRRWRFREPNAGDRRWCSHPHVIIVVAWR